VQNSPGGADFSVGYLAMVGFSPICLLLLLLQNIVVSLHNLSIFVMRARQIFTHLHWIETNQKTGRSRKAL
jgi:hypothetical protein